MRVIWDLPDDSHGNVQHIARHGLDVEEVEDVLADPIGYGHSDSSGFPAVWGYTRDGRYIMVVYQEIDEDRVYVVTAYETPEPSSGR